MHPVALISHPDTPASAVRSIDVSVAWAADRLTLRYGVAGDIASLAVPGPAKPNRRDELWRHTCFELFLQAPGTHTYAEFNFSPSHEWAAYAFDDYRAGMRPLDPDEPPKIRTVKSETDLGVQVELALPLVYAGLQALHLGLSAVIEGQDRAVSYWALAHPALKPDFHAPGSFILDLSQEPRTGR